MPVIAAKAAPAYLRCMASALHRLLALIALLLMPIAMAATPALAQPAPVATGHCDEQQQPADAPAKQQLHCAACVALPALDIPARAAAIRPQAPRLLAQMQPVLGEEPEIATPPPKLS